MKRGLFNPFTPEFRANPYGLYSKLREAPPEHSMGMWIVTRYSDVKAVLKDGRFSAALVPQIIEKRQAQFQLSCPELNQLGRKSIVFTDNPDHARLRRLTNGLFGGDNLSANVNPLVRQIVRERIDGLCRGEVIEFIEDFAEPVPLLTLTRWMNLPDESRHQIKEWTNAIRVFLEPGVVNKRQFEDSYGQLLDFMAFFRAHIKSERAACGPGFVASLLSAAIDGDTLSEDELIFTCIMAFVAGSETTKALLGNATLLLAQNPEQLESLHEGRVNTQCAINELFRLESPLQMTKRICLEDVEIGGVTMHRDEQVLLCLGAANHDPAVFSDPETLNLERANAHQHIAFGFGFHSCLGAYLAHMQLEAYLTEIRLRKLTFELNAEPEWIDHSLILRGQKRLSVAVGSSVGVA